MTYQSKYRENKRLIQGFAAYLDECRTLDEKIKLSAEIGRLQLQQKTIEQMSYEETLHEFPAVKIKVTALL